MKEEIERVLEEAKHKRLKVTDLYKESQKMHANQDKSNRHVVDDEYGLTLSPEMKEARIELDSHITGVKTVIKGMEWITHNQYC